MTTEPRTAEQLRCKFDNLKKDVRKYEAQKRQDLYRTGGGIGDLADIKATLKLLYAKIKSIISLSVVGLEPSQGDSDVFVDNKTISQTCMVPNHSNIKNKPLILASQGLLQELETNIFIEDISDNLPIASTSTPDVYEVEKGRYDLF